MSTTVFLKALGLITQPNHLGSEPGSLLEASNVIIRRDNIIESRRGFKNFGTSIGSVSDRAKQLTVYKNRILRHYSNVLEFQTGTTNVDNQEEFSAFSGNYSEVVDGLRIKFLESNGNLYFTSDSGIKRISATDADEFTTSDGYIIDSGGIKALDFSGYVKTITGDTSSFFPADSVVAYRTLWSIEDANKNFHPGTPSERIEITNPFLDVNLTDFSNLLKTLDEVSASTGSIYNDSDYISSLGLPITASASELRTNLIALASKLDKDEGELFNSSDISSAAVSSNVCTVTLSANIGIYGLTSVGDKIYLTGIWTGSGSEDLTGVYTVTAVTNTTIVFSVTAADGAVTLSGEAIERGWFRSITEPDVISGTIANHNDLQNLQDYLENIITELQSTNNVRQVCDNDGSSSIFPAELDTITLSGTVATVTTNAPADLTDILKNADLIYLNGTFSGASPSINGLQTVNATPITSTVFEFDTTSIGTVTLGTDSSIDKVLRFTDSLQASYINDLSVTTSSTVVLTINVPTTATLNHFFQIYRTAVVTATSTDLLSDLSAGDKEQLVYEAYPTQAELDARQIIVEDVVLDAFRGAELYTNADAETILQANDLPPKSQDINKYKEYTFYSNTSTLQRRTLALLGVTDLVTEYNAGRTPSIVIADTEGHSHTYRFIIGTEEITPITFSTESAGNYTGKYFVINSANDINQYYVWYEVSGNGSDPSLTGRTGIKIIIDSGDSDILIATKTKNVLNSFIQDFSTENNGTSTLTITNLNIGYTDNANDGTLGATITIGSITQGTGSKAAQEQSQFTCTSGSGLAGKYFTINTAYDRDRYYIWYVENGGGVDPAISGKTGVPVNVLTADTAAIVASKTADVLNLLDNKFITSLNSNILTIKNNEFGPATNSAVNTSGFTLSILQQGALDVLLSDSISPAQAVDETARNLVSIINQNTSEIVNAFYLSDVADVPGKMLFEARNLSINNFYVLANRDVGTTIEIGDSFNPPITPTNVLTTPYITSGDPVIITSASHGMMNEDQIILSNTDSIPNIDGIYTITKIDDNSFSVPLEVISNGTKGSFTKLNDPTNIVVSDNEQKPNRIYYSKLGQPEAVPLVNYLNVGAQDKSILRIMPVRDSLMIFKEDGIYRLSGDVAPFAVSLHDTNCNLICPDSLAIVNNSIFSWTNKGIEVVNEAGVSTVSRQIDIDLLPKNNPNYINFRTATWGLGYDSDNCYIVFTTANYTDTYATIGYVYNYITDSWTTYDKSNTCGVLNPFDNKLYLGSGVRNFLEKERKDFARTDYADREFDTILLINNYVNNGFGIIFQDVSNYKIGDVLTQEQLLTINEYNSLLRKLDIDAGVNDTNYFSLLAASGGNDLRDKLANSDPSLGLAAKLDVDSGVDTTDFLFTIDSKTGQIVSNSAGNATVISLKNFTFAPSDVNTSTNTITISSHGFINNDRITLSSTGTLPSGLVSNTTYFIINSASNTFKLSTTEGGSEIDITTQGTGTHSIFLSHNLIDGRIVTISNSNSIPDIDGIFEVTVVSPSTFSIPINVIQPGTTGSYETVNNDFRDISTCYNSIIVKLNTDSNVVFGNYMENNTTSLFEAIILDINRVSKTVTLNLELPLILGEIVIYESIISTFTYTPLHFGDPVSLKHLREVQVFFEDQTFTNAILDFNSDLLPVFNSVSVIGMGNGIFGHDGQFGIGGFFGGKGNSQPFRTYVPRNNQRCTYLSMKFTHRTAREIYSLYGISITGEVGQSTRAYR